MNIGVDFHGVITDTSRHKQRHVFEMFGIEADIESCSREGLVGADLLTAKQYKQLLKEIYFTYKALDIPPIPHSVEAVGSLATRGMPSELLPAPSPPKCHTSINGSELMI